MSKEKIYTAIGVIFALGGWMLFPIGYSYIEKAMMSDEEKVKIELEKKDREHERSIYLQKKSAIENSCGDMPDQFVIKGSTGDRFMEAEEWEEPVLYTQEIEDYWIDCVVKVSDAKIDTRTVQGAIQDIKSRHSDFDVVRVNSYLKMINKTDPKKADELNNPDAWEYLWILGIPQSYFKEKTTQAELKEWMSKNQ